MTPDDRRAAFDHALQLLEDAVADATLALRNGAGELEAHGGFESESLRMRTIACLFDSADDIVDAVLFAAPTIAAVAERLHEASIAGALAWDLRTAARVLFGRVARVKLAGG